jgi:hypothetical protein
VESQLGLFRAAIIVWVSGVVASALLGILVSPVAWALVAGSARHIDQRWGLTAILVLVNALIAGAGVTFGVGIFGFRLSYGSAVFALAAGGFLAAVVTSFIYAQTAGDTTGLAIPALGPAIWPLRLLLGLLLPAFLINGSASPESLKPLPPEVPPQPPYSV